MDQFVVVTANSERGNQVENEADLEIGQDWQPIETAPKDGTRVLLLTEHVGVSIGFFGPKYSLYGINYGDDWGYGCSWRDSIQPPPTHWMPLPDPPVSLDQRPQQPGQA